MEKYLTSLLELNNRVIVPDLGAFIIRQKEPKELVFNDLLAFDDGMLTDRIIQEEKLSKAEAQARIKQFVEKVKTVLEKDESYDLKNIGSLKMDASSRINLLTDKAADVQETEAGTEETITQPVGTETAEDLVDSKAEEDRTVEAPAEPAEEAAVEPAEETTEEPAEEAAVEPAEAAVEEPAEAAVEEPAEEAVKEPAEEAVEEPAEEAVEEPAEAAVEEPAEEAVKEPAEEAVKEPVEAAAVEPDDEGFILTEGDAEVDVDATREEAPVEPDHEEPPFQIEESGEEDSSHKFRDVLADDQGYAAGPQAADTGMMQPEEEKIQVNGIPVSLEDEENPFSAYMQPVERKRRAWPWILGMVALIAILIAATWFFLPDKFDMIISGDFASLFQGKDQPVMDAGSTGQEAETAGQDVAGTGQEAEGIAGKDTERPTGRQAGKQFYIVAGSFSDINNAERYVRTLRNQGFDASILGRRNNLHTVSFSAHAIREDAVRELNRIRNSYDPEAWLLHY
jgi:nucleoid DNA-binding protein